MRSYRSSSRYQEKIVALWSTFLLGTLFHTQLGLMPLFHGQSVAHEQNADITIILWLMLAFFAAPMIAMILATFTQSKQFRVFHFGLTLIYSVLNFLHVVLDLGVKPIVWSQIALMIFLLGIGLLLNLVAYQWMRTYLHREHNVADPSES
jgi:hypothetical protein